MSVSILVVDDETDVAELFRREARQGTYVLHSPIRVRKHSTSLPRASSRS